MTKSQNGWTASIDKSAIGIVDAKVPGTSINFPQGVRGGDVETVLMYVAQQFHTHVEPLVDGTCWGYAYRNVKDGDDLSNHSSGTAVDFNAPRHPLGEKGTYKSSQVEAIHAIIKFCDGVVRWGGDYKGRVDEMHFEIIGTPAEVAKLAKKIKGASTPPKPTPPAENPTSVLKIGSSGAAVTHLQQFLRDVFPAYRNSVKVKPGAYLTVDGSYGEQTAAWVEEFQKRVSIDVDGIVGPATLKELRKHGYAY